jgi:pimeloyl-ACP methyl ester carboxylesterase
LADVAQIVYLDHRGNGRSEDGPRDSRNLAQWGEDMARHAVNRSEVLQWFTRPGGESHTFDMLSDLHRIQCPTLVLSGEDDPIHPIESQADIAAALPQHLVRFERFANCRHAVVTDAPERHHHRHPRLHRALLAGA